jgi:hypothetical protein
VQKRSSPCVVPEGALKVNQLLIDPIVKLKADCPKIQEYLHVSLVWLSSRYKLYASDSVYPLDVDREQCLILSWDKASN